MKMKNKNTWKLPLLFALVIALVLIFAFSASAACENTVVYSGSCTPDGELGVYDVDNNLIVSQPSGVYSGCYNGIYSIEIGSGGAGCQWEPDDIVYFKIDGIDAGEDSWDGRYYLHYLNLNGIFVPEPEPPIPPVPGPEPIPEPNKKPVIDIDFNNGRNFYIFENISCSANIYDPDKDVLEYVYSELFNPKDDFMYVTEDLLNTTCIVHSPSNVTCTNTVNFVNGSKGEWACKFFTADENLTYESEFQAMLNTPPILVTDKIAVSSPVDQTILVQFGVADPDLNEVHTYSTLATHGSLDNVTGNYTWTPTKAEVGNYTFAFTVSDGEDVDTKNINFEIKSSGNQTFEESPAQPELPVPGPPSGGGGGGGDGVVIPSPTSVVSASVVAEARTGGGIKTRYECPAPVCHYNGEVVELKCYAVSNPNEIRGPRTVFALKKHTCSGLPTCDDGVRNGNELGVDCGGSCKPCPTCDDNIKNQGEQGVDCGGSCEPCPSCSDGVKNQREDEIDCGGQCSPCEQKPMPQQGLWESIGLWLIIVLIVIAIGATFIYEYKQHPGFFKSVRAKGISWTKKKTFPKKPLEQPPKVSGVISPKKKIKIKVAPRPAIPKAMPIVSKQEALKLIKQAQDHLSKNEIAKTKELIRQISSIYSKLPQAEKMDVYKKYMELYHKIKHGADYKV